MNNEDAKRPNGGGVAPEPTGGSGGMPPQKNFEFGAQNGAILGHLFTYFTLHWNMSSVVFLQNQHFFCLGQKVNKLAYKYSEKSILPFKMMKLHTGMWKEGSTFSFE